MKVYCYPNSHQSYEQICWFCDKLQLDKPGSWSHTQLHLKVDTLTRDYHDLEPQNPEFSARLTGLNDSIILFENPQQEIIGKFILGLKKNQLWPILSVITPDARKMSLGLLIEHLLDDRRMEMAIKKQQQSQSR